MRTVHAEMLWRHFHLVMFLLPHCEVQQLLYERPKMRHLLLRQKPTNLELNKRFNHLITQGLFFKVFNYYFKDLASNMSFENSFKSIPREQPQRTFLYAFASQKLLWLYLALQFRNVTNLDCTHAFWTNDSLFFFIYWAQNLKISATHYFPGKDKLIEPRCIFWYLHQHSEILSETVHRYNWVHMQKVAYYLLTAAKNLYFMRWKFISCNGKNKKSWLFITLKRKHIWKNLAPNFRSLKVSTVWPKKEYSAEKNFLKQQIRCNFWILRNPILTHYSFK